MRLFRHLAVALSTLFASGSFATEEPPPMMPKEMNAAEIELAMQKLNVLGRVLYLAAHPDDENTNLMALWANGSLYDAGYFQLRAEMAAKISSGRSCEKSSALFGRTNCSRRAD